MNLKLVDKTALVTGSSSGIGFATAEMLAHEGATVIINGRNLQKVSEAISKIKEECPSAKLIPLVADLSKEEDNAALIKEIPHVDILVNNLGIYEVHSFSDISDEDWLRLFNVNVMTGVRLSRHFLPSMLKQNWGRIIFISSESAIQIPAEMIHYGVTKTAQLALARGLAETTASTNVTVNSILPGPTRSEGVDEFVKNMAKERKVSEAQIEKEFFETVRPSSLLKRFATADEVAALITFVCSPLSSGINGAALRVDGGVIRAIV